MEARCYGESFEKIQKHWRHLAAEERTTTTQVTWEYKSNAEYELKFMH